MKTVYFVRHGQSEANLANVFTGGLNPKLTETGRAQARETAKTVLEVVGHPDLIIASPRLRTRETAEIIAEELGYSVDAIEYDERLEEADAGNYAGQLKTVETEERLKGDQVRENNTNGVEWIETVRDRSQAFVDDLPTHEAPVILLVGHQGSSRMLRRVFNGIKSDVLVPSLKNAAVLQLYPEVKAHADGDVMVRLI